MAGYEGVSPRPAKHAVWCSFVGAKYMVRRMQQHPWVVHYVGHRVCKSKLTSPPLSASFTKLCFSPAAFPNLGWRHSKRCVTTNAPCWGNHPGVDTTPRQLSWSRAARTDRGVSAVGQLVALNMHVHPDPDTVRDAINAHLPSDIRVLGIVRVTNGFEARRMCDKRKYEYWLPLWVLDPCVGREELLLPPYVRQWDVQRLNTCIQHLNTCIQHLNNLSHPVAGK